MRTLLATIVTALVLAPAALADDGMHVDDFSLPSAAGLHGMLGHWPGGGQRVIPVVDKTTAFWEPYVVAALGGWNTSPWVEGAPKTDEPTTEPFCPIEAGIIKVCNYAYGDTGWAGLAAWQKDSQGHFLGMVVLFNDSTYNATNNPMRLACHELGHAFGLAHQFTNASSCMDYAEMDNPAYWSGNAHDFETLAAEYSHSDPGHKTAVSLVSFTHRRVGRNTQVRWRTATETGTLGFHVYLRGRRLTRKLIAAKGPGAYTFLYHGKGSGFRLRELEVDGEANWYGPSR